MSKKKFCFISWAQNYAFTLGAFREYSGLITRVLQTLSLKTTDLSKLPFSEQFGGIAGVRVQIGTEPSSSLPHPQKSDPLSIQYPNFKHLFYIKEKHLQKTGYVSTQNQFYVKRKGAVSMNEMLGDPSNFFTYST